MNKNIKTIIAILFFSTQICFLFATTYVGFPEGYIQTDGNGNTYCGFPKGTYQVDADGNTYVGFPPGRLIK